MHNLPPGVNPENHNDSQPTATEQRLPCPPWCRTDHARTDRFERYIEPVLDLRTHSMDIARIPNQGGNLRGEVVVDVAVTDDLTNGGREGPLVSAFGAECMTPDTAAELAAAVLAAVEVATGHPGEPLCSVCDTSIEHIPTHPDGRAGGWRHTTDHGQEPHTAHPGNTPSSAGASDPDGGVR